MSFESELEPGQSQVFLEKLSQLFLQHYDMKLKVTVRGDMSAPVIVVATTDPQCNIFDVLREMLRKSKATESRG